MDLIFDFKMKGYVDDNYQITEDLIKAIENHTYKVPAKLEGFQSCVEELIQSIYTTIIIKQLMMKRQIILMKPYSNPMRTSQRGIPGFVEEIESKDCLRSRFRQH